MSTAAQLARRKIATPKSRTGRSTTPTMPSNPFQSQPQQQQSSSFQFGSNATASFPPLNTQSQSFQFTVPGASSSFTFGQSNNDQSQPVSNPFANLNGATNGFGSRQVDNTEMQDSSFSQQAQPVQPVSSSVFNFAASQPAPAPSTNGFSFGQTASQQSNGGFGGGLFGQQNTQEQNKPSGLFGQTSQPQQNGFTPSFGQAKESSPSPLFPPSSSAAATPFSGFATSSAPASTPAFNFGQSTSTPAPQPAVEEPANKTTKLFDFGTPQTDSASTPKKPSFAFGQPASAATTQPEISSTAKKPAFSFGQPAGATAQSDSPGTSKPSFGGFGQSTTTQEPATKPESNFFSGFGAPDKATEDKSFQQGSNLFNQRTTATDNNAAAEQETPDDSQKGPKNPFSSLFSSSTTKASTSAATTTPAKSPFQFGQSSSFASSAERPPQSAKPTTSSSAPDLFSPKPVAGTSSGGLFNLNKPTPSAQSESTTPSAPADTTTSTATFGFTPQKASNSSSSSSSLFKFGNQATPSQTSTDKQDESSDGGSPQKKRLFQGTSTPATMAQSALGTFNSQPSPSTVPKGNETAQIHAQKLMASEVPQQSVARAVSTEGPPSIPRFLSGEKYKVYDESWRLKALNRRFKDIVSGIDTEKHDFINVIQNYLDHREAIGEGLGGYERKKSAGTKRKATDVDDLQEESAHSKRTKPVDAQTTSAPTSGAAVTPAKPASSTSSANTAITSSFTPSKTVADTQTSSIFKSMIPGAATSNNSLSFKPTTTGFAPPKSTTPPSSPPKSAAPQLPKFEVPKFGGGGNFMSAFAKSSAANAKKFEQEAKEKRKAEDFDSDEDDEEEWNKQYEEEQRAKKAKIEAAARNALAVPAFIPSASSSRSNSPFTFSQPIKSIETTGSKSPELSSQQDAGTSQSSAIEIESGEESSGQESGNSGDDEADHAGEGDEQDEDDPGDEEEEEEEEGEEIPDIPPEDSLFSRITQKSPAGKADPPILQPAANSAFKPGLFFGNIGKGTPEQPAFSPFTPTTSTPLPKGDFVPTTKFNFNPVAAPSSSSLFGSSMLGTSLKDGPIPGEGLFGSRPSTPSNVDAPKASTGFSFGSSVSAKQPVDNTYKQGSPIKFGASTNERGAPSVEVTAATPPAKEPSKPFAGLFGQSSNNTPTNGGSLGFSFGTPSASTQPAPGFLSATSHLGGVSGTSSRATSPGILSEAESVATDNTEDYSQEPQTSLMSNNSGEENEEVVYESRAAISRMFKQSEIPEKSKYIPGWNKMGVGIVKVLKDTTTSKARIVFRAEPGANVIMNTRLLAGGSYKAQTAGKGGVVSFPVATGDGMQTWMIRVKSLESAEEGAKAMEANKKN